MLFIGYCSFLYPWPGHSNPLRKYRYGNSIKDLKEPSAAMPTKLLLGVGQRNLWEERIRELPNLPSHFCILLIWYDLEQGAPFVAICMPSALEI